MLGMTAEQARDYLTQFPRRSGNDRQALLDSLDPRFRYYIWNPLKTLPKEPLPEGIECFSWWDGTLCWHLSQDLQWGYLPRRWRVKEMTIPSLEES